LIACCEKRSTAATHNPILLTDFRIGDSRRVANRTSKFLVHCFYLVELPTLDPLAVHNNWIGKSFQASGHRTMPIVFILQTGS
jgi:hypothetical protein